MRDLIKYFQENQNQFMVFYILVLLIPALFINLGLMPFNLDEATRANVALEMIYSGNYIVPTINGEFYYNKPPLFNWIMIVFIRIIGSNNEFVLRLPTVVSLILFALTIYQTQKKEAGKNVAFLSALGLITCGRILFYDSFKGLIDISFSWIIYMIFWFIYKYGRGKKFLSLFMVVYLLAAMGFLMKGLPAIVFLGISLLVYFLYKGLFLKLFSLEHLAGFILFIVIVGSYLFAYSRYNSLDIYFETLWSESSKRTFLDNSLWASIKHLFTFPVDFMYNFLPWTLLVFILISKKVRRGILKDDFGVYSALIFIFNIIIYWVSPAIYPRYLFMFLPLFFYIGFRAVEENFYGKIFKIVNNSTKSVSLLLSAGIFLIPLFIDFELYDQLLLKYSLSILIIIPFIIFSVKKKTNGLLILAGVFLAVRISFNWFVFPDRIANGTEQYQKNGAIVAAELAGDRPLFIYGDTRIHNATSYYIMRTREQILTRWHNEPVNTYLYIAEKFELSELPPHHVLFTFETRIEALQLCLVQFD